MRQDTQLHLRLPTEIRHWLVQRANEAMRSINAEAVLLLTAQMERDRTEREKAEQPAKVGGN